MRIAEYKIQHLAVGEIAKIKDGMKHIWHGNKESKFLILEVCARYPDEKPLYHVEESETGELHSIGYEWLELA